MLQIREGNAIFTDTGECRPPKKGEYFVGIDGGFTEASFDHVDRTTIYTRTEIKE